jgi:hypothetical protein
MAITSEEWQTSSCEYATDGGLGLPHHVVPKGQI